MTSEDGMPSGKDGLEETVVQYSTARSGGQRTMVNSWKTSGDGTLLDDSQYLNMRYH